MFLLMLLAAPLAVSAQSVTLLSENFDSYTSGLPVGWTKVLSASDVKITSGTTHSGSYKLQFTTSVGSGTSYWNFVALPYIEAEAGSMEISFWTRPNANNDAKAGNLDVGYMTDITDTATFVQVSTVPYTQGNTYQQYSVPLTDAPANAFLAFRHHPQASNYWWLVDDVVVTGQLLPCPMTVDLQAQLTNGNGSVATLTWTERGTATNWVLQYGTDPEFASGTYTEVNNGFNYDAIPGTVTREITGLTSDVTYYARMKSNCGGGDYSAWSNVISFTPTDYTYIGTGTSNNGSVPTNTGNQYSLTEQIYTATELGINGTSGVISSIGFYNGTANVKTRQCDLYLVNTDKTAFSSSADWIPVTAADKVFSGTVTFAANSWTDIVFNTPFDYTGGNIVLIFDDNTSISNSGLQCHSFTGIANNLLYMAQNGTNLDPVSPGSVTGYRHSTKNRIRVLINPSTASSCKRPLALQAYNLGTNTATLTWQANDGTAWKVEYKTAEATSWTTFTNNVSATTCNLTGLTANTDYIARVTANCDDDQWATVTFTTACEPISTFPWTEDFESYEGNSNTSGNIAYSFNDPCWINKRVAGSGNYLFQVTTSSQSGNATQKLVMPSSSMSGTSLELALPVMAFPAGHEYKFILDALRNTNSTSYAEEGVHILASPDGTLENATELGFISHQYNKTPGETGYDVPAETASGWYNYEFILPANTIRIILKGDSKGSVFYLDNFKVKEELPCKQPSNPVFEDATSVTATLSWINGAEGQTAWQIAYKAGANFNPETDLGQYTIADVTSNPGTINGLTPLTTYYAYVRSNCGTLGYSEWSEAYCTFTTECAPVTTFPWTETFESYNAGNFSDPCWVNEHVSGSQTSKVFIVYTSTIGSNSTHQLQLPDETQGNMIKLVLPEMQLATGTDYQFCIDIYRSDSYSSYTSEGIRVFASADGEIEGATEMAFIPRVYSASNAVIPAETTANTWYTYKLAIPMSGSCHIILRGESQFGAATYLDNLTVRVAPSCSEPTQLEVSNIKPEGATFNWTAGNATEWRMEYRKTLTETEYTPVESTVSAPTYTFTNFDSNTQYSVRVRAVCSPTETTDPSNVVTFTTEPSPNDPRTLTVYEGTKTSEHVPFYCGYFYNRLIKTQHVIPAADLGVMDGDTIKGIQYYTSRTSAYTTTSAIDFYLKEVDYTTISSFEGKSTATVVYTGTVTIGSDGVTTIMFDTPYIYNGGNLLVGAENLTSAGGYPGSIYFYGQQINESAIWAYSPFTSIKTDYFIPKTTFIYKLNTTCPKPKNLTASNITASSATLQWTPQGEETEWSVQYRVANTNANWTDKGTVTSPSCTLDNLAGYTDYEFRVKPECTEGANWTKAATFKTLWTMVTVDVDHPYSTGFEGDACDWYFINGTQTNKWVWGSATQNGGSKSLYVSNDDGTSNQYNISSESVSYAIKPFHLNAGYHAVSFDWKNNGDKNGDYLRVALAPASTTLTPGTTPVSYFYNNVPSGWIALDGGDQLYGNSTWQSHYIEVNVSTGGDYVLVLAWANNSYSGNQPPASIDNFSLSYVTCPRPNSFTLTWADTDHAILNWTAVGSATTWNMQYKQVNEDTWTDVNEAINTHPYTLTGLEPGTDYQVRIQSGCGSNWTEPVSFKTLCEPTEITRFTERFSSLSSLNPIPECWSLDGTMTDESHQWRYTSEGHNGNGIYFIAYSNPSGQTTVLKTPILNLPAGETMQLSFWYKNDNGADFSVYISTDRGRNYTTALATNLTTTNGWTEKIIALPDQYIGAEDVVFVFKGTAGTSFKWVYLDDVIVEPAATCPKPQDLYVTALTENTATLAWTNGGMEDTWEIAYSTDPEFNPDFQGTHVTATTNPFTVTGLRSGVDYYAYVRAKCSAEDQSRWCNDVCTFYPMKVLTVNDGNTTNEYVPVELYWLQSTGHKSQFIIPASTLTELQNSQINKLTFHCSSSSPYFGGASFKVYMTESDQTSYGDNGGFYAIGNMSQVYSGTFRASNNKLEITLDTPFNYFSNNLIISIYETSSGSRDSNVNWYGVSTTSNTAIYSTTSGYVTNRVGFLPKTTFAYAPFTCPFDLTASNISAEGATLSWHPMGNETHWDVFYTENPDFVPTTYTPAQFSNIDTNPFVMTGVVSGRTYYVYVRANNGANGVSEWSSPCSFMLASMLTINEGTVTNNFVPVPGWYVDQPFNGEFVIPAADLQTMANTEIKQMIFYTTSPIEIDWGELDYRVYLQEVDYDEINSFHGGGKLAFSGIASVSNYRMTLNLDRPYYYRGGNLLVRFESEDNGAVNKVYAYWAGVETENTENHWSSAIQYRDQSWFNIHSGGLSFLPKTSFLYIIPGVVPQICENPTDLEVSNVTTTSATISWTANGNEQDWELQYWDANEASYIDVPGAVTNPYTLQNLESSHGYWVRVRAVCGDDFYSDWEEIWFSTECTPIILPYSYQFEDAQYGDFPPCWTRYYSGEGTDIYMEPSVAYHALMFGSNLEEYAMIAALPEIPAAYQISEYELAFDATGYDGNSACEVGVMSDPTDPNSFELVQALEIINDNTFGIESYRKYRVSFENYTGNGTYIAIRQMKTTESAMNYMFIDNVVVRPITTCFEPTALTVTDLTTTTATVQWTAEGGEAAWHVQLKRFEDNWPDTYQTVNQNTHTFNNLEEGNMYQVRVRTICSGTETSDWSYPVSFTPVYNVPFFEDFGQYLINTQSKWGWQVADAPMDDVVNGTSLNMDYTSDLRSAYSNWNLTDDVSGMTYIVDGYYSFNISSDDDHKWIVTPSVALGENCQLSFDLFMRNPEHATLGLDDNRFAVLVSDNNGATWTRMALWDEAATEGRGYFDIPSFPAEVNFDLSAYSNKTVLFAFYAESTVANDYATNDVPYSQIYIDKINVTRCIRPDVVVATEVTATSAVLDWTAHGETTWTLRYRIDGDEDWTTSTITEHPYNLTGVQSPNYYQVQLKAHNAFGESEWSDLVVFATGCTTINLAPNETYVQTFKGSIRKIPACWSIEDNVENHDVWEIYDYGQDGYARASVFKTNTVGSLITPEIYVTPGLTLVFSHSKELNTLAYAEVLVMRDYSTSVWDSRIDDLSSGTTTISLNDYVGQTITIWFTYHATINSNYGTASYFCLYDVSFYNINTFTKQTNDGYWTETDNWSKGSLPVANESVTIDGAAIIPNDYVAQVDEIYLTSNGSLTLGNGAQLKHNNEGVEAKVWKAITPYTILGNGEEKPNGWNLIASPMRYAVEPSGNMLSNKFDLYRFNQNANLEWENYYQYFYLSPYFKLFNGRGYLYANAGDGSNPSVMIDMDGKLRPSGENVEVPLVYNANASYSGWNLVGNPFACNAYLADGRDFYVMNPAGDELVVNDSENGVIAPIQGLFVQAADTNDDAVTFTTTQPDTQGRGGALTLNVYQESALRRAQGPHSLIDRARVRFGEGPTLGKFSMRPSGTRMSIMQDHQDYAVVYAEKQGEVPVNFKTEENGTYTISVSTENTTLRYLHLIDNLTGADVDMLVNPSYTFEAKTSDYASRFRLVFNAICEDADGDSETFAFISNGNIIITGDVDGATLQVIDVMGHVLVCRDAARHVSTSGMTPGVYVLRLIKGDGIKTQKIVVR